MPKLKDFKLIEKEWMKRPGFRKEYEAQRKEFELAEQIIKARIRAKMTQADLARKIGTKKQGISRLESPGYKPLFATLRKVADATGSELQIRLVPKSQLRKAAARKRA